VATSPERRARHRATGPARTPIHDIAQSVSTNAAPIGRGAVITAISTGMLASVAVPASAAPEENLASVDTSSLAGSARTALAQEPVSVPADAEVDFSSIDVTAVEAPEAPEVRRSAVTESSRDNERTEPEETQEAQSESSESAESAEADVEQATADAPDQSVSGGSAVEIAARYVGTPYVSGGRTPDGFDCSGFVHYVYKQLGKDIPATTAGLRGFGTTVSASEAQPGDLVMFSNINHVGIYAGNGKMYDAARPGKPLQHRDIFSSAVYYIRVP